MTDCDDVLQLQRFEDVIVVQRQVVNVAKTLQLVEVGEPRRKRRNHCVSLRQAIDDRRIGLHTVQAVQPHEWWSVSAAIDDRLAIPAQADGLGPHHDSAASN